MRSFSTKSVIWLALLAILFTPVISNADTIPETETTSDSLLEGTLRVFVDCSYCDRDYIVREITFVSFVRDREQADIHILVSRQRNAAGGQEYMLEFIGRGEHRQMVDTLRFNTIESDTEDYTRDEMDRYLRLGLVRFVAKTELSEYLEINFTRPTKPVIKVDKWNKWIFDIGMNMWASGGEAYSDLNMNGNIEARRVTEETKIEFGSWGNYSEAKNNYGASVTIQRSWGTYAEQVFAINDRWSYAFQQNLFSSTLRNKDIDLSAEVGLEYNLYPYRESSRQEWKFSCKLGSTYMEFVDTTIYDKTSELFTYTRLKNEIELIQPWGSVDASINGIFYFHDMSKHRITLSAGTRVRIFDGFSVNLNGNYSRTRDQFHLRKGELSEEDILLRRIDLASGYSYWMSFGVSYSFGSIYSSVVNSRF